ncbi:hypothetical protein K431DRAFT_282090 [Polychaeton citri CBS 116435]|uniref:Uncharacterized protein n=1 Tax=Polychaeton citri CBS 116435 TaxID=1314669 RepID=A0A9P4UT00_9PEZI|nr:hypothetical protein K431DRAFT_282090 [Polychaeton citri CBS 116435]
MPSPSFLPGPTFLAWGSCPLALAHHFSVHISARSITAIAVDAVVDTVVGSHLPSNFRTAHMADRGIPTVTIQTACHLQQWWHRSRPTISNQTAWT